MNWIDSIVAFLPTAGVLLVLCYLVNQCARVNNDITLNAQNFGDDNKKKFETVRKSVFNFYMVVCLCVVVIVGYLKIFGTEIFTGLFVGILVALGVKLGMDLKE